MKRQAGWLTKILPFPSDELGNAEVLDNGYKSFTKGLCIILTVLVLVPLIIISVLSHNQYQQLLEEEELDQMVLNLEVAQSSIEAFIGELTSVVRFVGSSDRPEKLLSSKELHSVLSRLQKVYPGVVDIQLVDSSGMQKSYAGPYELRKHNYSDQIWYKDVLEKGVAISNVFSGFRNIPHFVIAVGRDGAIAKENCVLRVTVDANTLQDFIDKIAAGYADDMFLVDSNRISQTKPLKYGKLGGHCVLHDSQDLVGDGIKLIESNRIVVYERMYKGDAINHGVAELKDTPWKLVLIKEQYLHANSWVLFKTRLTNITPWWPHTALRAMG